MTASAETRCCPICGKSKPLSEFPHRTNIVGVYYRGGCQACYALRTPIAIRVIVLVLVLLAGLSLIIFWLEPDKPHVVSEPAPMINVYDRPDGREVTELRSGDFMIRCTCPKKGPCEAECTEGGKDVLCSNPGLKCREH